MVQGCARARVSEVAAATFFGGPLAGEPKPEGRALAGARGEAPSGIVATDGVWHVAKFSSHRHSEQIVLGSRPRVGVRLAGKEGRAQKGGFAKCSPRALAGLDLRRPKRASAQKPSRPLKGRSSVTRRRRDRQNYRYHPAHPEPLETRGQAEPNPRAHVHAESRARDARTRLRSPRVSAEGDGHRDVSRARIELLREEGHRIGYRVAPRLIDRDTEREHVRRILLELDPEGELSEDSLLTSISRAKNSGVSVSGSSGVRRRVPHERPRSRLRATSRPFEERT